MKYLLPILLLLQCQHMITGSTDEANTSEENGSPLNRVRRGGLSMLRLGRGLQMLRLGKRSMPMLRMGRSLDTLSRDELKYLISAVLGDKFRRQVPLPRYGREEEEDAELQWLLNVASDQLSPAEEEIFDDESPRQIRLAPRPGRYRRSTTDQEMKGDLSDDAKYIQEPAKQNSEKSLPLPRFGRILYGSERALPLPRFGREDLYDYVYMLEPGKEGEDISEAEKRGMHMLRLGRGMNMLRLGKRQMNMLRLGRSEPDQEANEGDDKRSLSMLRLGKRLRMLRLGKRDDAEKRSLRMMRLGKKDTADSGADSEHSVDTRGMNMLRLGRNVYE